MKSQAAKKPPSIVKIEKKCGEACRTLRSLSHPGRLKVLGQLTTGEKSVSDLQACCGLSQSQMSQFLTRMKAEGLVLCRRDGRYQKYGLADKRVARLIEAVQAIFG
jgi:ArsR family transcriptional regulator, virulence genes transcriptional regulator